MQHRLVLSLMRSSAVRICVPVCMPHANELGDAIERAAHVGDMIEVRLDCLAAAELNPALREIWARLAETHCSIILTMRAAEQGGHNSLSYEDRYRFWSSFNKLPGDCLVDLELALIPAFTTESAQGKQPIDWNHVICSQHDFAGVPADFDQLYERMAATPARILKFAFQANDAVDCLALFRLLDRAQREGREVIAIAMGQAGITTRILGPSRGSFLTYGSLSYDSATAPGQLTVRELRDLYRIDQIDRDTEITGLVGTPVGHSISPRIHNAAFAAAEVNAVFLPFEVRDVASFMRRMVRESSREIDWNLRGLSVTAPHKRAVMNSLDWIERAAKEIGAVNTILVQDRQLHGYNTDAAGFISPLQEGCRSLQGARCAVIGAGGAARAVLWSLQNQKAHAVLFVRNPEKANPVAAEFGIDCYPIAEASFDGFDIVVNATPLGTLGGRENETPATAEQLRGVRWAYDLVYNPLETRFQREARMAGCQTIGGVHMLIAQAVDQFKLWTGKQPDLAVMRAAALKALSWESSIKNAVSGI